jgi:hypothetical protein
VLHQQVPVITRIILSLHEQGDDKAALEKVGEFEIVSNEVLGLLDELYADMDLHIS